MSEDKQKHVDVKGSSKVDWLSSLPESLLCKILIDLPTKDVVKSSVLSKRWKNLWRYVPALDLDEDDFPDQETFVSFVDSFLGFNSESYFESFKLIYNGRRAGDGDLVSSWINSVVDRRVKHLQVWCSSYMYEGIPMPPNLFTSESLVSLKLDAVDLELPKFVYLPSLHVMDLISVLFDDDLDLETLISGCPVLESLSLFYDYHEDLRVCSQSLLSFTHVCERSDTLDLWGTDNLVVVNAPRLQYLRLGDYRIATFILNNTSSLVEADIDTVVNLHFGDYFDLSDLQKRKMIRSFLECITCVKKLSIVSKILEVIYHYSRCELLPLFRNLSFLRVRFINYGWEMMPIFLESCPNLKSLVVEASTYCPENEGSRILSVPRCLLSSLEYVDIKRPLEGEAMEMKLLSYFLKNSAILKKLTVCFDRRMKREKESAIFKELLSIPRLSSSCEVIVL